MYFLRTADNLKKQVNINAKMRATILFLLTVMIVPVISYNYGFKPEIYPQNYGPKPEIYTPNYGFKPEIYHQNGRVNISHNLTVGRQGYADRVLYYNVIHIPSKWLRIVDYNVTYPLHGYGNAVITYIRVIDLKVDGTGGYPRLLKGGVGYRNVTIGLTSQRGHGLHFNISIFGK